MYLRYVKIGYFQYAKKIYLLMLVVFFLLYVISSSFVIQQEMTDILEDITAAISSGNTATHVIIWNAAKASRSKKNRSRCGGHHSRRRYSRRKKQRTPMSKDTATLFKKKSSGGSRRRRSRRKRQKCEFTSELKSNGLLVNKAPTKSKHAKGTFTIWPISSTRKMLRNSCFLVVMFALLFLSKLLTGTLSTFDNDLPAFGYKDSLKTDFCFEKLPTVSFPSVNYANPKTPRADICGALISFQQADEDMPYFLALPNENNANDFERGCSMDGNNVQQKTKNNNGNIGILFGPSRFTLLTVMLFQTEITRMISERGCSMDCNCQQQKTNTKILLDFHATPVLLSLHKGDPFVTSPGPSSAL